MRNFMYVLLFFPVVAFAQGHPEMPPNMPNMEQMQEMQRHMQNMDMGKMQEAMACMNNIDRSALAGLEAEGKRMEAEVAGLCKQGKRDVAEDKAMEYAQEMMSRPELKKMQECGKIMEGMMPKMPFADVETESKDGHICDDY